MSEPAGFHRIRAFRDDTRGAIAIEFAFLVIPLLLMLAFSTDLANLVNHRRDVDRLATQVSLALAACPDSDCVRVTIDELNKRRDYFLFNIKSASIGMAEFAVKNKTYPVTVGTMTYLTADLKAEAERTLENNDVGTAVAIDAVPVSYMSGFIGSKITPLRGISVSLRAKNTPLL